MSLDDEVDKLAALVASRAREKMAARDARLDRMAELVANRAERTPPVDKHVRLLELAERLAQRNRELDHQHARLSTTGGEAHSSSPARGMLLQFPKARVVRNKRQQREATATLQEVRRLSPGITTIEAWRQVQLAERISSAMPSQRGRKPWRGGGVTDGA